MRARDFLNEASVLAGKYGPGSPFLVSPAVKGQKLLFSIQQSIPDFTSDEVIEKVKSEGPFAAGTEFNPPNEITIGAPAKSGPVYVIQFKRRSNNQTFNVVGSRDSIESSMIKHHEEKESGVGGVKFPPRVKGLVSEALLGIAMYAKLIARQGDMTAKITPADIWGIVDRVKPRGEDVLEDTVYDRNSKIADTIHLSITVAADVQQVLTNPQFRTIFADNVAAWVKYANSDLAQKYADVLYKNQRPDSISILLAGKKGEKLDVAINVLDAQGRPTRRLEQVKLSVKLSDGLIGQVGRGDNPNEVYANLVSLFKPLGINLAGHQAEILAAAEKSGKAQQFVPAMSIAYQAAYDQLQELLGSPEGDAQIATRIAALADSHATGGDPNLQVIEISGPGDYKLLNYKGLLAAFKELNINITCSLSFRTSTKTGGAKTPDLLFYDANVSGPAGRLVDIRVRGRGGEGKEYASTIIEPLPLIKKLAAFRRFRATPQPKQTPAAQQPAAPTQPAKPTASTSPVANTTPGIANQNTNLAASKIPMGSQPR